MKILLICLAVLSVLILFLLFIRLNFYFEGYFNNESKNFMLRFYVFTKKLGFNIKFKETKKEKEKKEAGKAEGKDSFIDKAKRVKNNINILKNTFSASKGHIKKSITVKYVNFSMDFGLGDAALTGISTGVLWGVIYSAFALVCKLFTVKEHKFSIDPIFNKNIMKINLGGVVYTRLVDILAAAIIIFRNYSKAKKLFEEYKPEISDKKIKDYK
ncbi:DUF2953 domain-containing protein [Qingrenia yutianensis]|uniref:DUF2953 domain-containing protein n=1 Tax=Qingrenia yutianensis TaxID=2763676 RepID=A0A926FBU7_9FIRM|nr:DUF2953 domain-containing protein [Qingrenia yutianensis]MBC8595807.1 DUF2953 domain-containing protein [Qingrenia yutianensis]